VVKVPTNRPVLAVMLVTTYKTRIKSAADRGSKVSHL
jgi:hypothetical protein